MSNYVTAILRLDSTYSNLVIIGTLFQHEMVLGFYLELI